MSPPAILSYGLSTPQFNSLFSNAIEDGTLESLEISASTGNLDSLDMLHNIALRDDIHGKKAENILFDLFSGKTPGNAGLDKDIQEASLKLYQSFCSSSEDKNFDKLRSPSKLLYMTGAAVVGTDMRKQLSDVFTRKIQAQSPLEQINEDDLWGTNRMLTTDEIHANMVGLGIKKSSINFPNHLIDESKNNILASLILDRILSEKPFQETEYFPINTGNHWVLFCIYQEDQHPEINKVVVFNSSNNLKQSIKENFKEAADWVGAEKITYLEKDIQGYAPNGCGMFVSEALRTIENNKGKSPEKSLKEFIDHFSGLPATDQEMFNIQKRRQIYGHSLE